MGRRLKIAFAVAALVAVAVVLVPRIFAELLYETAVARQLASDPIAELGPGLHVILVGTGSPLPDPSRVGPMTAVVADGRLFVFDAGDGSGRRLGQLGYSPAQVERVFLTHLHSDHFDGLGQLLLARWAGSGADTPMPVHGPDGVEPLVDGLRTAYARDAEFRVAHHGADTIKPGGYGGEAITVGPGTVFDDGRVRITAFAVPHDPVSPAYGYAVEHAGRKVVLTGDTSAFDPPEITMGADLLVSEALNPAMVKTIELAAREAGNATLATIMSDIPDYHITPSEVETLAAAMGAKQTVLSHIVPAAPNALTERLFVKGTELSVGSDGDVFSFGVVN